MKIVKIKLSEIKGSVFQPRSQAVEGERLTTKSRATLDKPAKGAKGEEKIIFNEPVY
ncbi:MAG: hypothetical protein KKE37_03115 [Verrucomicrobia bacterium]|nr:hypothetical protein [Verrucomicrobiota bacterium]MBU4428327.1 hypothetical protein [Verrucomicrobiota bacterium]MCG2681090.1 hypothetical protein [Kiritimatiellia bacterium]